VTAMTAALAGVEELLDPKTSPAAAAPAAPIFASLPLGALATQLRRVRDMHAEEVEVVRRGVLEGFEEEMRRVLVVVVGVEEDREQEADEQEEAERERRQRERLTVAIAAWGARPCVDADAADRALATLADEMVGF